MEVFILLELLPDQGGADHLAVLLDQAALRLLRKDDAGNRRHGERIGKARDRGQQDQHEDGGADFFKHCRSPQSASSLRAKRSNPWFGRTSGWIASSLRSSQ
ncbi:hypothetical protein ACVWW1_003917 [Bradyrhizobium sp. JR3.5]